MKRFFVTLLLVLPITLVSGAEQLIPAGSVMQCMISDKISSKTTGIGDPVLCQVSRVEVYGRSTFPYGAYLQGRFEEYKDPGHFVGKGWMELKFDRMVVGNDTVIPISTRVVATSEKNRVDNQGKIHGLGHPVRDTVEWLIPVLWPIDLINLPRRGPYPVLKPETRLTVKVLDDFGIPSKREVQSQPELISRYNYSDNESEQPPVPAQRNYAPTYAPNYAPSYAPSAPPPPQYAPAQQSYAQPNPTVVVVQAPAPTIIQQAPAPTIIHQTPIRVAYPYPVPMPYYGYPYPPPAYRAYYPPPY